MATDRTSDDVRRYYDQDVEDSVGAAGAGMIWFITADHLSPSLSNRDEYVVDSRRWREATQMRVVDLARRMSITSDCRVLDLGTGIGGPGRDIVSAIGCTMFGINLSARQLRTLRARSARSGIDYDRVVQADLRWLPFRTGSFDAAFSVNVLYHVPDPARVLAELQRVLIPGGRFGIDDWFLTDAASVATASRLRHDWSTPEDGFHVFDEILHLMAAAGLVVDEVVDYSYDAGLFLTEERFGATFDIQVAPKLVEVFPQLYRYQGYRPEHALDAAAQLRTDILHMGSLYRSGEAVYRQIVGSKPGAR